MCHTNPDHQWRIRDVTKLGPEEKEEYDADVIESNRRYDRAFVTVLSHTTEAEQEWRDAAAQAASRPPVYGT